MSEVLETLQLAELPALKQPLAGGIFVGVITLPDGKHYAVVKLDAKPDRRLSWKKAIEWAQSVGGQLPSRTISALMFAVAKELFEPAWHWTSEEEGASYAWYCYFDNGYQLTVHKSAKGCAVAVRLIPLTA